MSIASTLNRFFGGYNEISEKQESTTKPTQAKQPLNLKDRVKSYATELFNSGEKEPLLPRGVQRTYYGYA